MSLQFKISIFSYIFFCQAIMTQKHPPMSTRGTTNGLACITASARGIVLAEPSSTSQPAATSTAMLGATLGTSTNCGTGEVDPSSSNRLTSTESQRVLADLVSTVYDSDESES